MRNKTAARLAKALLVALLTGHTPRRCCHSAVQHCFHRSRAEAFTGEVVGVTVGDTDVAWDRYHILITKTDTVAASRCRQSLMFLHDGLFRSAIISFV